MNTELRARREMVQEQLRVMRIALGRLPHTEQEDVATYCRAFRNMLAAGKVARLAFMVVMMEITIDISSSETDGR